MGRKAPGDLRFKRSNLSSLAQVFGFSAPLTFSFVGDSGSVNNPTSKSNVMPSEKLLLNISNVDVVPPWPTYGGVNENITSLTK